jgi:hypothetical protein
MVSAIRNVLLLAVVVVTFVLRQNIRLSNKIFDSYSRPQPCEHLRLNTPPPPPPEDGGATTRQQQQQQQEPYDGLNPPNSKLLPLPNENGIIIFFFHIPKTGGTTMMAPFVKHPDWRYRMVYGPGKQKRYRQELYDWLDHWEPGTQVYYEYHAGKAAPYMDSQVREDLLVWRAMAKVRNIPFFAFTIVREPLSMAVSHFNFYYASGDKKDPRYFWVPDPTEQDFMELSVPNPQCLFCVKSELAYYEEWRQQGKSMESTPEQCDAVYEAFLNDLDWIGTMEGLSDETFPILEQLGRVRYCPEVRNKSHDKISKSTLSERALQFVQNTTALDQSIYQRAQRDFPITMWKNLDRSPKEPWNPKKRCKYKTGQPLPPGELPKRPGELRRFLERNPEFEEVKGEREDIPHYLKEGPLVEQSS